MIGALPSNQEKARELTVDIVPRPSTQVCVFRRFQVDHLCSLFIDIRFRAKKGH